MESIVPQSIAVKESERSVGWYRVRLCLNGVHMEMLTAVDGMAPAVQHVTELGSAEREGFARQAIELTADMLNRCLLPHYDREVILPGLRSQGDY